MKRILLAVSVLATCVSGYVSANEVNVYSARKEELIKPLLDQFETDQMQLSQTFQLRSLMARYE